MKTTTEAVKTFKNKGYALVLTNVRIHFPAAVQIQALHFIELWFQGRHLFLESLVVLHQKTKIKRRFAEVQASEILLKRAIHTSQSKYFEIFQSKISINYELLPNLSQFFIFNFGASPGPGHEFPFEGIAKRLQALSRTGQVRPRVRALPQLGSWNRGRSGWPWTVGEELLLWTSPVVEAGERLTNGLPSRLHRCRSCRFNKLLISLGKWRESRLRPIWSLFLRQQKSLR